MGNEYEIYVVRVQRMNRKTKERVEANRAKGMCICCGEKKPHKREICTTCHGRFMANKPKGKRNRATYDAECVQKGMIGESRQGQKSYENPYQQISNGIESGS